MKSRNASLITLCSDYIILSYNIHSHAHISTCASEFNCKSVINVYEYNWRFQSTYHYNRVVIIFLDKI